jgi:hypothetical protein
VDPLSGAGQIPYDALVADDYDAFLSARAEVVMEDIRLLSNGEEPAA